MARNQPCGCGNANTCTNVAEAPLVIEGECLFGEEVIYGISHGGKRGCAAVTACVGDYLGAGLLYNNAGNGQLSARISGDGGNCLAIGSDRGLYVGCPTPCEDDGGVECVPCNKEPDPRFATGVAGWNAEKAGHVTSWDQTHGHSEFGSLRVTVNTVNAQQGVNVIQNAAIAPAATGQTWSAGAWVYHEDASAKTFRIAIRQWVGTTATQLTSPQYTVPPKTWTWIAAQNTLTTAGVTGVSLFVMGWYGVASAPVGTTFLTDEVFLANKDCLDQANPQNSCTRTASWLRSQDFWHGGSIGAGPNISPYGSRAMVEVAARYRLPAINISVTFTADGLVVFPNEQDLSKYADYSPPAYRETYPTDITTQHAQMIVNRISNWYGHEFADEDGLPSLPDVWEGYKDRFVWFINVNPEHLANGMASYLKETILDYCMQDQVVVITRAPNVADLKSFKDAGIHIGALADQAEIDAGFTPQQARDAGCEFVLLNNDVNPSVYPTWVAASDLTTVLYRPASRYETDRAKTAGLAGALSDDPPYTARQVPARAGDPWFYAAYPSGQLASATQNRNEYRREGQRGMHRPDASGGWIFPTSTGTFRSDSVLLGWAENTPSGDYNWKGALVFHVDGADTGDGAAGFVFASPTDAPVTPREPAATGNVWHQGSTRYPAANGYMCQVGGRSGILSLYRVVNGAATQLGTANLTGALAGAAKRSTWYYFDMALTSSSVTVTVRSGSLSGPVCGTIAANDTTHRGGYLHLFRYTGATPTSWQFGYYQILTSNPA